MSDNQIPLGTARVRISRVRPRIGGAQITMLPVREAPDDTNFVPTLVWALDQARQGKLLGYAGIFTVELPDGTRRNIEFAKAWENIDNHYVLGLIRRTEIGFIARTWPEDFEL